MRRAEWTGRWRACLPFALGAALAGCGGAAQQNEPGSVVMSIRWPSSTVADLPPCAASVQVILRRGSSTGPEFARRVLIPKLEAGTRLARTEFAGLPVGRIWIEATAHHTEDATDTPGARAETAATVLAGRRAQVDMVTQSTIRRVQLQPPSQLNPGRQLQLVANAYDSAQGPAHEVICTSWAWSSDRTEVADINPDGLVTAHKCGGAVLTVTEMASHLSAQVAVTIQPTAAQLLKVQRVRLLDSTGASAFDSENSTSGGMRFLPQPAQFTNPVSAIEITFTGGVVAADLPDGALVVTRTDTGAQQAGTFDRPITGNVVTWRPLPVAGQQAPLPASSYTVTLKGDGATAALSQDGCRLDGDLLPAADATRRNLPSGDGVEGGDFSFVMQALPPNQIP